MLCAHTPYRCHNGLSSMLKGLKVASSPIGYNGIHLLIHYEKVHNVSVNPSTQNYATVCHFDLRRSNSSLSHKRKPVLHVELEEPCIRAQELLASCSLSMSRSSTTLKGISSSEQQLPLLMSHNLQHKH